MEQGFDPEVRNYFKKIMSTFGFGFLWLFSNITVGMYFGLAFVKEKFSIANLLFYSFSLLGLAALIWYYYKLWKK
jgi:hypothetical protein